MNFLIILTPPSQVGDGLLMEPFSGGTFQDKIDQDILSNGLRLSYLFFHPGDAVLTAEVSGEVQTILSGRDTPTNKYFLEGSLVAYEFYRAMGFRLAAGGGVERRDSVYNPSVVYRGGLGYYPFRHFAIYLDMIGRQIFRESRSAPTSASLSLQFVF